MDMPKWARGAGLDGDDYRRLLGRLYEIDTETKKPPPEPPPANKAATKEPQRTQGAPSRDRKDPVPASGKDLQTRIKQLAAELRKKYGLPRETGEKPPPPPPDLNQPPATGPTPQK